jgi:hypothetical protein
MSSAACEPSPTACRASAPRGYTVRGYAATSLNWVASTPSASAQVYTSSVVEVSPSKRRCKRLPSGKRNMICKEGMQMCVRHKTNHQPSSPTPAAHPPALHSDQAGVLEQEQRHWQPGASPARWLAPPPPPPQQQPLPSQPPLERLAPALDAPPFPVRRRLALRVLCQLPAIPRTQRPAGPGEGDCIPGMCVSGHPMSERHCITPVEHTRGGRG